MFGRLAENWVYGAALMAPILLLLIPLMALDSTGRLIALALPVYLIHQYEEHDADRFRRHVNEMLGADKRGLSPRDVLVINFVGVWVVILLTLYLYNEIAPGWGLIAAYLLGINGLTHVIQAGVRRRSNPGLITSLVLFFPLAWVIWMRLLPASSPVEHIVGAGLVIAAHLAILWRATRPAPQ
ncbi:MAG: HXXEE domain-containing protein [Pseudomonadota bacterium]